MPGHQESPRSVWKADYQRYLEELMLDRLRIGALLLIFVMAFNASIHFILEMQLIGAMYWVRLVAAILGTAILVVTYRRPARHIAFLLSLISVLILSADLEAVIYFTGFYDSPYQTGLALLIIAAGLIFPYTVMQMAVICVLVWAVYLMPGILSESFISIRDAVIHTNALFLTLASVAALTGSYMTSSLRQREFDSRQALREEQAKSEYLLLNVLPKPIADRLKRKDEPIADGFDDVTVLFGDIVGFTPLSQRLPPSRLVALLNDIFSRFDEIAERHGLEKIKTIGDAYMVAGGVPVYREHHAEAVAEMALDMLAELTRFNERTQNALEIRIGIACGPVVAGVIGKKKFAYDLWGDTVNTASRMESHGVPGSIHVTAATYNRLRNDFELEERGLIEVKGKGEMRTYLLTGRKQHMIL